MTTPWSLIFILNYSGISIILECRTGISNECNFSNTNKTPFKRHLKAVLNFTSVINTSNKKLNLSHFISKLLAYTITSEI